MCDFFRYNEKKKAVRVYALLKVDDEYSVGITKKNENFCGCSCGSECNIIF